MLDRLRTGWLAGGGAILLVLSLAGGVMGANLVTDTEPAETPVVFTDLDGNGIDDACQDAVVADVEAAAGAFAAADLDDNGAISIREAAHSGWAGGTNCNHGGYVSQVATAADEHCDEGTTDPAVDGTDASAGTEDGTDGADGESGGTADCAAPEDDETDETPVEDEVCEAVPAPTPDPAFDATAPGAHGAWASLMARSDAVGGKNCNHGGAVSEAVKKDHEAAKAARDAAKAARDGARAERAAARAERAAAREAAKAAARGAARAERAAEREQRAQDRAATKAGKSGGNGKGKSH